MTTTALEFEAIREDRPGLRWQAHCERFWPGYYDWYLAEGEAARPSFRRCRNALHEHMPELTGLYEQLCELAGGGDLAARFLSLYRPPPYISGCSQTVWPGDSPVLIRNYDYAPALCEATLLSTSWGERRVIAMSDCLWGVLDGMNDAGLCASLTFGGRRVVGNGFGVPLVLRYVLEFCETTAQAAKVLTRVPTHMAYNVTLLDGEGRFLTIYLSPDRDAVMRQFPIATNHQGKIEWRHHARSTGSLERERFLFFRLVDSEETAEGLSDSFMDEPLYSTAYERGFGTLYTTVYQPDELKMEVRWPDRTWRQSFETFEEGVQRIDYASMRPRGSLTPVA